MSERSTENENEDCAGSGNETGERRPWSPGPSSGGEICDCSMSELDLNEAKLIQIRFMLAIVIIFCEKFCRLEFSYYSMSKKSLPNYIVTHSI